MERRSIEDVLRDHTAELMAVPGVVGVYQGARDDGTPCLRVMVIRRTPEIDAAIPEQIEGYPVEIEAGGEIRPLPERRG